MKRLLICLTLVLTICSIAFAQQTASAKADFFYYPLKDVYYNSSTANYYYYDRPTGEWIGVKELPSGYQVNEKMDRYEIAYSGTDVWKDHKRHKKEYKVKKDGTVKVKSVASL